MTAVRSDLANRAASLDGRTFRVRGMASPLVPGDLVVLGRRDGTTALGQLLSKRSEGPETAGEGAVIGLLDAADAVMTGPVGPFVDASIEPAPEAVIAALEAHSGADMHVGSSRAGNARLASQGFNRHTFLCGQSGSGKSYALGVILEQLLIDTELPLLILDPNADFVGLGETLDSASPEDRERLEAVDTRVLRARPDGEQLPLRVRFSAMDIHAKAAVLRLDPLADRTEYHRLLEMAQQMSTREVGAVVDDLLGSEEADDRMLAQRIDNLGVLGWDVWAGASEAMLEGLEPLSRATVIDLAGFEEPRERLVVSLALLDHLWANRERRQPLLLVIDEAHNVCEANPSDPLAEATTSRLIQIANEGRKYGIWLLLCTQRPSRIHEGVLAQCDNLMLMRMNSPGDLMQLERLFGFVPPEMLRTAPFFHKGEALMAGGFAPAPAFVQMRRRRTREGGGDVRVPRRQ